MELVGMELVGMELVGMELVGNGLCSAWCVCVAERAPLRPKLDLSRHVERDRRPV